MHGKLPIQGALSAALVATTSLLGTGCALGFVKTLRALLYGVSPADPASFGSVAAILFAVALAACWLPTRAAVRVDPSVALRSE